MSGWHPHPIEWKDCFEIRKPVLEKMLNSSRWYVSEDGETLNLDLPLGNYSPHERDIIEFVLNPYHTGQNIFAGLDRHVAEALTIALNELFGPGGYMAG